MDERRKAVEDSEYLKLITEYTQKKKKIRKLLFWFYRQN